MALQTLKENHLYAKFLKYDFWMTNVTFLRHVISEDGISMDPKKIKVVQGWLRLTLVTEI